MFVVHPTIHHKHDGNTSRAILFSQNKKNETEEKSSKIKKKFVVNMNGVN